MSLSLEGGELFFAKTLANSSDEEQGRFFNEFGRLLYLVCRGSDSQVCYMASKLDAQGRRLVTDLAAYIALRDSP